MNHIRRGLSRSNLRIATNYLTKPLSNLLVQRGISDSAGYDGDGRTTVTVINALDSTTNFVTGYSKDGFRLHNDLFIKGSILLFPTHVFAWNLTSGAEITLESLSLFDIIVPKVKIVVIGYGSDDEPHDLSIALKLKKKGISCEMLPTRHAVSTYNYLVHDAVHVAGAFVTDKKIVKMPGDLQSKEIDLLEIARPLNVANIGKDENKDPLSFYRARYNELSREDGKKTFD